MEMVLVMREFCYSGLFCALLTVPGYAQSFVAKVNGVYSGDTILVRKDREETKLRFRGVHCPPENTVIGTKAKRFIEALLLGQMVHVRELEKTEEGEVVGTVLLENQNPAVKLLSAGLAEYRSEAYVDEELAEAEGLARSAGIGIWSGPAPVEDRSEATTTATRAPPPEPAEAVDEMPFKKVRFLRYEGDKKKERDAHAVFTDSELIISSKNGKEEYARIPFEMVDEITYERSSHPRWETAAAPSIFGSFGDKKKHWLTIIWLNETGDTYTGLRLDKDNYQDFIAACEARIGIDVTWIVEYEPRPF